MVNLVLLMQVSWKLKSFIIYLMNVNITVVIIVIIITINIIISSSSNTYSEA